MYLPVINWCAGRWEGQRTLEQSVRHDKGLTEDSGTRSYAGQGTENLVPRTEDSGHRSLEPGLFAQYQRT